MAAGGGPIQRVNLKTEQYEQINVWPMITFGRGAKDAKYRFNWQAPFLVSSHDPNTIYMAGNVVFRTRDEGMTWEKISDDLTLNLKDKMKELYQRLSAEGSLPLLRHLHQRPDSEEIVVLFVATLELVRLGAVRAEQRRAFAEIYLRLGERILDGETVSLKDRILYRIGELLVYGPLKNRFGLSRVRVAYTAGEAIGPEIFRFYRSLGINLKQLYGQTEAAVYITNQPDGEIFADTVGAPLEGIDVKIDQSGEVLYRSKGVFKEYYKNPEATKKTKTKDGWVHSGDAGFIDDHGHLKIIDRAKDVGKLKDGTLFPPTNC